MEVLAQICVSLPERPSRLRRLKVIFFPPNDLDVAIDDGSLVCWAAVIGRQCVRLLRVQFAILFFSSLKEGRLI